MSEPGSPDPPLRYSPFETAKFPGANIHIYEEGRDADAQHGGNALGGALDATEVASNGLVMRGGRMFEKKYLCTYDLLSAIPSLDDPNISARDDIFNFTHSAGWNATARARRPQLQSPQCDVDGLQLG